MKKINMGVLAALLGIFFCLTVFPVTVFAGGVEEIPLLSEEREIPKTDTAPLTPDGNLTLVDDISGEKAMDKQFATLVSKNGNYFYLIIDRAGDKENVYFLNLVDEADLLALIEEDIPEQIQVSQVCNCSDLCEDGKINTNCPICKNDFTKCIGKPTEPMADPEIVKDKNNNAGSILLILLVVGIAGGGFYYFKVVKNKGNTKGNTILDEYDFEDDEDDEYEYEIDDEDENEESEDIQ